MCECGAEGNPAQMGWRWPRAACVAMVTLAACVWTFWPPPACWRASDKYSLPHQQLTVFAMFKNEADVLGEWLDHYYREGAHRFILVDNGSTDNATVPTRFAHMVTRIYDPRPHLLLWWLQSGILHEVETEWVLPLDMDEFAFATDPDKRLVDVLDNQSCFVSRIQMESYRFGDSGLKKQPKSVRTGFVRRGQHTDPDTPKTIVRPERVAQFWIHRHRMLNPILDRPHWTDEIQLNHFGSQTLERWKRVQMTRGTASLPEHLGRMKANKPHNEEEFARKNQNDVADYALASRVARRVYDSYKAWYDDADEVD